MRLRLYVFCELLYLCTLRSIGLKRAEHKRSDHLSVGDICLLVNQHHLVHPVLVNLHLRDIRLHGFVVKPLVRAVVIVPPASTSAVLVDVLVFVDHGNDRFPRAD